MAAIKQIISNQVVGDTIKIERLYTGLPAGETIAKAYFTVKLSSSQADPGVLQLSIVASSSESGQITQVDTDSPVALYFVISSEQSAEFLANYAYQYDIQLISSDGDIITAELGTIRLMPGFTDAVS